jgi:hypothetical protein
VVATWAAGSLPKLLKNALLWLPRRAGRGCLGFFKEAFYYKKASQEPVAAALYAGYNLALLVINVAIILSLLGGIAVYQMLDPSWLSSRHLWTVIIAALVIVVLAYGAFKRFLFIGLAATAVFNPPKESTKLKIGKFEMELPPKPVQPKSDQPKPVQPSPPPTKPNEEPPIANA